MANPFLTIKKSRHFVTEQIWNIRIDKVSKRQGFFIKQLRVFSLAIKGFKDDKCLTTATALTFYTLFSIVPILALIFAIAKGVGVEKDLQEKMLSNNQEYQEVLSNSFVYANKLLATTKGGVIAGFGVVLLLWSVMNLLINIENSFNHIWEIKRGRTWIRKVTDYLTIMLIGPLFLMISGGLTVAIQAKIGNMHTIGFFGIISVKLLAYTMVAFVFTFLYMVLPNTKVNFKSAFAASIIATLLFELLGWGYIKFQIGANRLNAIYGGFAALPLFLIWVQYCWYIVLFGAQLSYANQNVDHYELDDNIQNLSTRYKKVISLMIANLVAKRFYSGEKSLNAIEIAQKLDLPAKLARNIINEFVETGVFVEVRADTDKAVVYQPGVTESKFDVKYLFDALDKRGVNTLPMEDTKELIIVNKLMQELDASLDSHLGNMNVKDIVQ
ncbi:MAG: YihY/virulence factor BrkB family protein [Bacteroidetes bacterium]|nr:YihY/virulence factor BrkB family protein [Bacteroidota bacterium]